MSVKERLIEKGWKKGEKNKAKKPLRAARGRLSTAFLPYFSLLFFILFLSTVLSHSQIFTQNFEKTDLPLFYNFFLEASASLSTYFFVTRLWTCKRQVWDSTAFLPATVWVLFFLLLFLVSRLPASVAPFEASRNASFQSVHIALKRTFKWAQSNQSSFGYALP